MVWDEHQSWQGGAQSRLFQRQAAVRTSNFSNFVQLNLIRETFKITIIEQTFGAVF